jgi:hypothetical protein
LTISELTHLWNIGRKTTPHILYPVHCGFAGNALEVFAEQLA